MRTAFIQELVIQARKHPEIFLAVGDLGFSVIEPFAEEFPDRYLNVGIAEQNMAGVAAGLASEGYHVFTYSIANFPTFRCLEQIRNDIAYQGLPVTTVSVGGGLAYGSLGYSHHAVQDYAALRCLPGMMVVAPGDPAETHASVEWLCNHPQPSYLRLGKAGEPEFHAAWPAVEPGAIVPVIPAKGKVSGIFLTTGAALRYAVEAAASPDLKGEWAVYSLPIWDEPSKAAIVRTLNAQADIPVIAVEDHLAAGGFGSYLREAFGNTPHALLKTVSLDPCVCGAVASQNVLNRAGGLSAESLVETARASAKLCV